MEERHAVELLRIVRELRGLLTQLREQLMVMHLAAAQARLRARIPPRD